MVQVGFLWFFKVAGFVTFSFISSPRWEISLGGNFNRKPRRKRRLLRSQVQRWITGALLCWWIEEEPNLQLRFLSIPAMHGCHKTTFQSFKVLAINWHPIIVRLQFLQYLSSRERRELKTHTRRLLFDSSRMKCQKFNSWTRDQIKYLSQILVLPYRP